MATDYSDQQLQAFLDEALSAEAMAAIEVRLRSDSQLMNRIIGLAQQREAGVHGLGEIWRRHRLSCPDRQQLGGYLLGTLDPSWQEYIRFHIKQVACRLCQANLEDLQLEQQQMLAASDALQSTRGQRRRKYFQSSAGYLRDPKAKP